MSIIGCVKQFGPHGDTNTAAALNITDKGLSIMAKHQLPSPALLRQLLDYDPETGILTWRKRSPDMFRSTPKRSAEHTCKQWNSRHAGKEAFIATDDDTGYLRGEIDSHPYLAHRVIYCMIHGSWPEADVDHIDRDRSNNRANNLRSASRSQNLCNRPSQSNNLSGFKGVSFHKGRSKYFARIGLYGKQHFLGYFNTPESAHEAYCLAAKRLHGEFSRVE